MRKGCEIFRMPHEKNMTPGTIKYVILISAGILLVSCGGKINGEFGFARTDDRDIEKLEKNITHAGEYVLDQEHLNFYSHETIWWLFIIRSGSYEKEGFLAALYENNNTPQPVEVDLRQVYVEKSGGEEIIRQSYEPLPPGRYLLRIAHKSEIIAEKEFVVFPTPGSVQDDNIILDDEERIDPIKQYSRF